LVVGTATYTATVGTDVLAYYDDLRDLLDWVGGIHETGENIAVWKGATLVLVIDGQGHTIYLTDPEAHR
jgi:hypothetical protein